MSTVCTCFCTKVALARVYPVAAEHLPGFNSTANGAIVRNICDEYFH